ncbi:nitroreductase family protein [Vibrio owensii]|uniref:nitroreductase family protein n=1 Tax=Vibrio owensii TaxID=696485 RepID=UPI003DA0F3CF
MKHFIKVIFRRFQLELNSLYDYSRYKKYFSSEVSECKTERQLASWILQDKHRIEKGLSLPKPRYNFGKLVIKRLVVNLEQYQNLYEKHEAYYFGVGAIKAYEQYHMQHNVDLEAWFYQEKKKINQTDINNKLCDSVGLGRRTDKTMEYKEFFEDFSSSRHSCRYFDVEKKILDEDIKNVVELSITAPSVCNRQHWHVHIYTGSKKNEILGLQNGNTGFTENIPYIAVITSDIQAFYTQDERNQPYIDGGIFSMNFMYALHSKGFGACALNWCNSLVVDKKFHKITKVPDSQVVIMIVAFGLPHKDESYAKSPRMPVDNFYTIN